VSAATRQFSALDQRLAALTGPEMLATQALRARGRLLSIRDALVQHSHYFDARE
jgi:hypothetical protein